MYCDRRLGGLERWVIGDPREALLRIPDQVLSCVFFLAVGVPDNLKCGGTGFFLSAIRSEAVSDRSYVYLVTAKHSIENAKQLPGTLYLRLNTKDGGNRLYKAPVDWEYKGNRSGSDAAVAFFPMPWDEALDISYISALAAVTPEIIDSHEIGIGDELCMVGLFTEHRGTTRNLPIVRGGILASMPQEPPGGPGDRSPISGVSSRSAFRWWSEWITRLRGLPARSDTALCRTGRRLRREP